MTDGTGARCRCGRSYDRSGWLGLAYGYQETDEAGRRHEYRRCASCDSCIEGSVVLTEESAAAAKAEREGRVEDMYRHLDAAQARRLRELMR